MISTRYHAMGVAMSMVAFTVTKVATVRAKAKPIQNFSRATSLQIFADDLEFLQRQANFTKAR